MTRADAITGRAFHVKRGATEHRQFILTMLYTLPLLLAVVVYGYAVTLPFFLDDGPHFAILAQTNGLRHWGDFPAFPFYRPLTFSVWKLFEPFGYSPPVLHWLNVLCFGMAAVLLGQIARRLMPRSSSVAAVVAGCFVVIFPFSYQAVVMVAALFHLTLALGVTLALWAFLRWLGTYNWRWLLLCWLGAFVAAFSHESGILVLPLLIGAYLLVRLQGRPLALRQAIFALVPVMLIVFIYLALWLAFDPREDSTITQDLPAALAVMLQGLIYPLAMLLRPLINGDIQPLLLLALALLATLTLLAFIIRVDDAAGITAAYGLGWYALAILPASLFLSAGYVLGQPRLALLASLGGGIFWGVVVASIGRMWPLLAVRWFGIALMAACVYIALDFLWLRRADFTQLRDYNRDLLAAIAANTANSQDAALLLVNMPDFITPDEAGRKFLIGTEGVLFVDQTLDWAQQLRLNSQHDFADVQTIAVPALQRSAGFNFNAHPPVVGGDVLVATVQSAEQIYMTRFSDDGRDFYPALVGGVAIPLEISNADPLALFDAGAFTLITAYATYDAGRIEARLRWQAADPQAVKTFVHVLCDGALVAQSDGYPWGDTYPFAVWSPGEGQTDVRVIDLTPPVNRDCLQVVAGLYTEADVTRLRATTAAGVALPDDAAPIPILSESNP